MGLSLQDGVVKTQHLANGDLQTNVIGFSFTQQKQEAKSHSIQYLMEKEGLSKDNLVKAITD